MILSGLGFNEDNSLLYYYYWLPLEAYVKGKGKGRDTCYSASYMSRPRDHAEKLYNLGSGMQLIGMS